MALLLVALSCAVTGGAQAEYPSVTNQAWQAGEKLEYAVRYGPIRAGTSTFTVQEAPKVNDRRVLKIEQKTVSADWFFYRVHDSITSLLDMNGLFSWRSSKSMLEGDVSRNEKTEYFPDQKRVQRTINGKEQTESIVTHVKDMLGALYYFRAQNFKVGDTVRIPVHDGGKSYDLEIAVRSRETVRVGAGTFNCLVVEPKIQSDGTFVQKGKLLLWVTDDQRHIPVRIRTMIPIGSVVASLERMEGTLPR